MKLGYFEEIETAELNELNWLLETLGRPAQHTDLEEARIAVALAHEHLAPKSLPLEYRRGAATGLLGLPLEPETSWAFRLGYKIHSSTN